MASTTSRLMMLFLLVGVGACAVEGQRTNGGWNGANKAVANNLARVAMPAILMNHASPLDTKAASSYAAKMSDGSLNGKDFCVEAKLLCDADVPLVDPTLDISLKNLLEGGNLLERAKAIVDASQAMFFDAKELVVGKDIKMPATLRDQFPTTSFLPESLALKLMPFSGDRIAELLQKLNIPPNSNLAVMMSRTLAQCDAKSPSDGDAKAMKTKEASGKCVTSMEDMSKFVADRFPQEDRIDALERTVPATSDAQDSAARNCDIIPCNGTNCTHQTPVCVPGYIVADAAPLKTGTSTFKVLDVKEYSHSVVCHKNMFPFAVYECHNMDITKNKNVEDNMKIYAVAMESREEGHRMNQIASCRAADVVGSEKTRNVMIPEAVACHWLSDAFVWAAPTNAAEIKN